MDQNSVESVHLDQEKREVLVELLESERAKLLVEIRHTDHRSYRDGLRHRLEVVELLIADFHQTGKG
jgi:hypothetical protein